MPREVVLRPRAAPNRERLIGCLQCQAREGSDQGTLGLVAKVVTAPPPLGTFFTEALDRSVQ
jgi:hypothetical protein